MARFPLEKVDELEELLAHSKNQMKPGGGFTDSAGGMDTWLVLQVGNHDLCSQGHASPSVACLLSRHVPMVFFLSGHSPNQK